MRARRKSLGCNQQALAESNVSEVHCGAGGGQGERVPCGGTGVLAALDPVAPALSAVALKRRWPAFMGSCVIFVLSTGQFAIGKSR